MWQPAKYTGTYGTNGFYLPFTNLTSTSTLGNDFSGNSNNWTTNNISLTAGSTYDSMLDVPTLTSATAANYCVLNPLDLVSPSTLSAGNLNFDTGIAGGGGVNANWQFPLTGKFYFELYNLGNVAAANGRGLCANTYWESNTGDLYVSGSLVANIGTYTSGDTLAWATDCAAQTIKIYKNNALLYTASVGSAMHLSTVFSFRDGSGSNAITGSVNFGQMPFIYTPPSGFVALNTFNLPSSTIPAGNKFMDATTYTGNGSSQSIVNSGAMQPDFVWVKDRSTALNHILANTVAGITNFLNSNTTSAESSTAGVITAVTSTGFSVGSIANVNANTDAFVGWQWKAGGAGVTNTAGSITSTVSANTTSGFSVVTYTGTAIAGTIGHGLGVAPQLIIVKPRTGTITTDAWNVYHVSTGNTNFLVLNATDASTAASNRWNNTSPTSSVFSIGTVPSSVSVGYVAYCFTPIAGFSAFGSYTGNGSTDGPFVYTGFRPRWVMVKRSDSTSDWTIVDTARNTSNVVNARLFPNLNIAEETGSNVLDIVSNGFKFRIASSAVNASGGTYIYAAFAENPFKNALAR